MGSLDDEVVRLIEAGEKACLATLIRASGSVPMSRRARMLVRADGSLAGTVGGGCLEAEVWRVGREVLVDGRPRTIRTALTEDAAMATGMVCGGSVEIFLQPVEPAMAAVARAVADLRAGGGRGVLATVVSPEALAGAELLVLADGGRVGGLPAAALEQAVADAAPDVLRRGMPRTALYLPGEAELLPDSGAAAGRDAGAPTGGAGRDAGAPTGAVRLFLQPIEPTPTLYLFGAGHVGIAVAQIGSLVGMGVVVIDDRAEFANRERFPQADEVVVADYDEVFDRLSLGETAYVVSVTRGHKHDETVVERALRTPARYIGMIGSRRKVKIICESLRERGATDADLARIHAPIGLEIGADTPEEIAVSIMAEVIGVRRGAG